MKSLIRIHKTLVIVLSFLIIGGMIIIPSQVAAQNVTQGDVALKLAQQLGFEVDSADSAIAALTADGIVPAEGWSAAAAATDSFIGNLYTAVNSAITQGTVTAPAALGNASALVAAAATAAGMPSSAVVNAVTNAGGNRASASQGASYGTAVAGGITPGAPAVAGTIPTVVSPTPTGPSGGAAGGGGGTSSPSS